MFFLIHLSPGSLAVYLNDTFSCSEAQREEEWNSGKESVRDYLKNMEEFHYKSFPSFSDQL